MDAQSISTQVCIAGGGPAGIMLGFLLARAGIDTTVLEKWPDFFRDFRGDTIHPSTMEILFEVGLLDEFLKLPINKTYQLSGKVGNTDIVLADFSQLKTRCPFIAFIPQWDFLNFIVAHAKKYPQFHLLMETEATDLIFDGDKVVGVTTNKNLQIKAELVVAADGRHSTLREKSHLTIENLSAPMDVLWFKLSRTPNEAKQSFGRINNGRMLVMLERGDYWQCGFLIRKGSYEKIRAAGLEAFRENIVSVAPTLADKVNELTSWEQIKFLEVRVERLNKWYLPGFLCIGDAAHAMSPIGGVGINLAIQDAVAAANILTPAIKRKQLSVQDLAAVQKRREWPTRVIQKIQVFMQNNIIDKVLGSQNPAHVPFIFKMVNKFPFLRRIPAYLIGIGVRPEHYQNPP